MTTSFPARTGASNFTEPMRRFSIGQSVRLVSGYGSPAQKTGDVYRITGLMPATDVSFQYRLRQDSDLFERVATEESLDLVRVEEPDQGKSSVLSEVRT